MTDKTPRFTAMILKSRKKIITKRRNFSNFIYAFIAFLRGKDISVEKNL